MMRRVWCLAVACACLLAVSPALAGWAPDRAEIRGPGLAEPMGVADPAALAGIGALEDRGYPVAAPAALAIGYRVDRLARQGEGYALVDRLVYYPPAQGGPGLVFDAADGRWFRSTAAGDAAMAGLLAGVPAPPARQAAAAPALDPQLLVAAAALVLCVGLALLATGRLAPAPQRQRG